MLTESLWKPKLFHLKVLLKVHINSRLYSIVLEMLKLYIEATQQVLAVIVTISLLPFTT